MEYIYITSHGRKLRVLPKVYNGMYRFCTEVLQKEDEVMERLQGFYDDQISLLGYDVDDEKTEEAMISALRHEFLYIIPEEQETVAEIYWESFLDDHYYTDEEKGILKEKALLDLECEYFSIVQEEAERQLERGPFDSIAVIKHRLKKKKKEALERYQAQLKQGE